MSCGKGSNGMNSKIPHFWGFTEFTPTIPKLYWNVKSQEQRILRLFELIDKLICYADMLGEEVDGFRAEFEQFRDLFEQFLEGGMLDFYYEQLEKWIKDNLPLLYKMLAKQVYFGLTDDGYFCAYVPESWDDIEFDTGMVYGQFDYGRLILRFNAEGSGVIDNTGRYDDASGALMQLERRVSKTERTLYTPMSAGGDV